MRNWSAIAQSIINLRKFPIISVTILMVVVVIPALFPTLLTPHDPVSGIAGSRLMPPAWLDGGSWEHPFGTDRLGRDILARIIHGSRYVLVISLVSIFFGALIGSALGMAAGYFGGLTDAIVMRAVDVTFALPSVLVGMAVAAIWDPSFISVVCIIVFVIWSFFARQVRAETLSLRERDFINRARVAGIGDFRIIATHILPNVTNTIVVMATLQIGVIIILESTLSFLGIGIPRPLPAWGLIVADGRALVIVAWWISFFPGMAILLVVLSVNLFGDWLRNRLDPKLRNVGG